MGLYQIAVRHPGLKTYRVISGSDWYTVNMKARVQYEQWEQEWRRQQAHEMRRRAEAEARDREKKRADRDRSHRKCLAWAAEQTAAAEKALAEMRATLERALSVNDKLDWGALLDRSEFARPRPEPKPVPPPPDVPAPGEAPDPRHPRYRPDIGMFDRLSGARRQARTEEAQQRLLEDRRRWAEAVERSRTERAAVHARYAEEVKRAEAEHRTRLEAWERDRDAFLAAQRERNEVLHERERRYAAREPEAVVAYCHMVLARSDYPDTYPRHVDIALDADGTLTVEVAMPPLECIPDVRSVAFDQKTEKYVVTRFEPAERALLHRSLVDQIALRTAHELFEADRAGAIERIAFSGWLRDGSASTCAVSFEIDRETFATIDLRRVDASTCVRGLASDAPRRQRRVEQRPRTSIYGGFGLDDAPVEDFEHFVRELLERDVAGEGERISVARVATGVDALVIEPAPTRGVRVVVHARRGEGACSRDALDALAEALAYERGSEGMLVTTCEAPADVRAAAEERGLKIVDATQLLARLATASSNARKTAPIARHTADLDGEQPSP